MEKIKAYQPLAEENVEQGAPETLNARRGRQKQAVEQLKLLREQYAQQLMRSSVFILSVGSESEALAVALSERGVFIAPTEHVYEDLANRIHPSLYLGKEATNGTFDVLTRHLEDKTRELGILEYNQLIYKATYRRMVNSREELIQLVKLAINEQIGSEIVGIQAVRDVTDVAIKANHGDRVTAIVLDVKDPQLALNLLDTLPRLTPNVVMLTAGKAPKEFKSKSIDTLKTISPENVDFALNAIKNKIITR